MHDEDSLPVFVFPTQILFYIKDASTHRHLITIYNPYDFTVCFQIMCTAPANYSVIEPEGVIKSRCCVDIAIRRTNFPSTSTTTGAGRVDKFRVCVKRRDRPSTCGFRDVIAELFVDRRQRDCTPSVGASGAADRLPSLTVGGSATSAASEFRGWPSSVTAAAATPPFRHYPMPASTAGRHGDGKSTWPLIIVAGLCIACLSAPNPGSEWLSTMNFPRWLALSPTQKLVAAYVLGLITSALLLQH